MATLSPCPKLQFFDNDGRPAAGFKLYTYSAGTTTPLATYADRDGAVENSNPIILDARGECVAYLSSGQVYDFVLTTASDAQVWTRSGVTADSGGADALPFVQGGAGAVSRSTQSKLREIASPEDFGAVGDGGTDDTAAIQAAIDAARVVRFKPGSTYRISQSLIVPSNRTIIADGATVTRSGTINNMLRNYADGSTGGVNAAENITIIGGLWDSTSGTGDCTVMGFGHAKDILIERVEIRNANNWHHIELNACEYVTVRGCRFRGGQSVAYTGNEAIQIDAALDSSKFPWFGPYDDTSCQHILIDGNYFYQCGAGVGTHSEATLGNHIDIAIINNFFDGLYYYAIVGLSWSGVRVINNRIQSAGGGVLFSQNTIRNNVDILIADNTIYAIGLGTHPANGRGIHLSGNSSYRCQHFRICNNFVKNVAGSATHGITVDYGEFGTVAGNGIDYVNRSGIFLFGSCNGVSVTGNSATAENVSSDGYAAYRFGTVNGSNANRLVVTGNFGATMQVSYTQNSVISHNNLFTSLTASNNEATCNITDNLVGATFS